MQAFLHSRPRWPDYSSFTGRQPPFAEKRYLAAQARGIVKLFFQRESK